MSAEQSDQQANVPGTGGELSTNFDSTMNQDRVACTIDNEKAWIFHRNREQPQPDPKVHPLERIGFYLDRYKIKEALQIFFDPDTLQLLHSESDFIWDLIPLICGRLRGLCQYRFRVFEGCERMLWRIAVDERCNPKEVLIVLLAQISQDDNDDDNVFKAMIRPLEGTLFRMNYPSPQGENYIWVLSVLMRHIGNIELPQDDELESKRARQQEISSEPKVKRFIDLLPLISNFIEEFSDRPSPASKFPIEILTRDQLDEYFNDTLMDECSDNDGISESITEHHQHHKSNGDTQAASVTALMSLMSRPFASLDLTQTCPDMRLISNKCLFHLLKINPNMFAPIYRQQCDNSIVYDDRSELELGSLNESITSLAVASYLYRCERVVSADSEQWYPQVMSHEFSLESHIPYVVSLLKHSEALIHEKGLLLLQSILLSIPNHSLGPNFLILFEKSTLMRQLFQIMIYSIMSTSRRKAHELFGRICDLLDYPCKLNLLMNVLKQTDLRPCARAASIDQYRKYLTSIYRELMILNHQLCGSTDSTRGEEPDAAVKSLIDSASNRNLPVSSRNHDPTPLLIIELPIDRFKIETRISEVKSIYTTFAGSALTQFLELCIHYCLPDSQHTDIIENYELLLATLTMLRFLKLRKKLVEDPFEETFLLGSKLSNTFFEPIRAAIALVRIELKSHQERDEIECLNWVLCRLDLVESVLARTSDLYGC